MRRATLSIGLVILFILSSFSPLLEAAQSVESTYQDPSPPQSEIHFPTTTAFSPSLDFWTQQEIAKPMVLTRDLQALHQWQIDHELLPEQASGDLKRVTPSSGIVEHRRVTMPGILVAKLAGVEGVFAVYDDSTGPEPVGALPGEPNSVKTG